MKLADYLESAGKSQAEFAGEIKVTRSLVNNWLSNRRLPSCRALARIEAATDQKVTAQDFLT